MDDAATPQPKLLTQWRIVSIIFGVLTLGLGAWYYFGFRDEYAPLYSDLRSTDAAAITADLTRRGVRFRTAENGREILVPTSQLEQARSAAGSAGAAPHAIEGFELFDQSDMGLNEFAERIRYQRAIQGELERTIMTMDGVVSARVHISMPDRTPFRGERQPPGAAVSVVMRAPADETPGRVEGIQRLVAASVIGLTAADVVVLNGRGEVLSPRVAITDISATLLGGDGEARRTAIDLVTQVMRTALPDLQFEVSIEQAAAAPPAGAATEAPIFTRIIKVATETALSDLDKQRVRAVLHNAGLVDGSLEQTVLFSVGLSSDVAQSHASTPAAIPSANALGRTEAVPSTDAWPSFLWMIGALALGGAVFGALFIYRRSQASALTASEHQKFAERLRQTLSAHKVDAA